MDTSQGTSHSMPQRRSEIARKAFEVVALGVGLTVGWTGCFNPFDRSCRQDSTCAPVHAIMVGGDGGATGTAGAGGGSGGQGGEEPCAGSPLDPADGALLAECGVWVSSSSGDDAHPGTPEKPVRTIARAIELAQARTSRIYACGEPYFEAVVLPTGVSLFGGFTTCDKPAWTYVGVDSPATISPGEADAIPLTLVAGEGVSFVGDVWAQAENAIEPGGSSISVFAADFAHATFLRSTLVAGDGADGADGPPGDSEGASAQAGIAGKDGIDACTAEPGVGGEAVTLACPDGSISIGGPGGDGGELAASAGGDGEIAPMPNPIHFGAGGKAQDGVAGTPCTPGFGGAQGKDGKQGNGGTASGRLTAEGKLIGGNGEDGTAGAPGQGGGGGGGSFGNALCGGAPHGGGGGGSGGTGGCGGRGGLGGQAGGSSVGLATRSTDIHFASGMTIRWGKGGKGGNGGVLQFGGQSGLPGLGGSTAVNGVEGGCAGGAGGQGGTGGHGGGGRGGHAVAIAFVSTLGYPDKYASSGGAGGKGGLGGDPFLASAMGNSGASDIVKLDP